MMQSRCSWLTPALLTMYGAMPVCAQDASPLKLKIDTSLHLDSNLFRLPASADTASLIGKSGGAEQIHISSLSLSFSTSLSLQKFELNLNLADYRYQNFNYLNFASRNYNSAWRWSLTPRLRGNLSTEHKETFNNFSDFQMYDRKNQRTNTNTRFDALYELDGAWRIFGGVSQSAQIDVQHFVAEGDYSATSADMGLGYALPTGSLIAYTRKNALGKYLNSLLPSANLFDDGFSQIDNEVKLNWVINGKSTVDLRAAYISRTHPHYFQRDYSGLNTGINLNWRISGKSALTLGWVRELSSYQNRSTNYTQTDRFLISPVWQVSPKSVVRLSYELATRDFLGSPTGLPAGQRSDITRDAILSFDWQPYQYLTVSALLKNTSRASSQPGFDYDSRTAALSAQFSY